jgi:hypothetical protein
MPISTTPQFATAKEAVGYSPIFLVEILGIGEVFATRDPNLIGPLVCGQGWVCGTGLVCGGNIPTYKTFLQQLSQDGIGKIVQELDGQGLARTGDSSVDILNGELYHQIVDTVNIENARIRVRLGFEGASFNDYIPIFTGVVDEWQANYEMMSLELLDDTVKNIIPLPPQLGSDFFPRSFTVGRAIPIILGDQSKVPVIQIIGDAAGTLGLPVLAGSTQINIFEVNEPFPSSGEITIQSAAPEVIQYTSVKPVVISNQNFLQFDGLTRNSPLGHNTSTPVVLSNFQYTYLIGFQNRGIRRVRLPNNQPTTTFTRRSIPIDPSGGDDRRVDILEFATPNTDVTVTAAAADRGENLIKNGEGDADPGSLGHWTIVNANVAESFALGNENVIRIETNNGNNDGEIFQDFTTVVGKQYRTTFTLRNLNAPFISVNLTNVNIGGTVFDFGPYAGTTEQGYDLTWRALDTTTRLTLLVDSGNPSREEGYFDHIETYELDTENPATQIENLINRHMPTINADPVSFDEARLLYDADQSRLSGIIQEAETDQELLGRLAFQFRAKTFLDESGKQKLRVFDNSTPPIASITPRIVDKGSFSVTETSLDDVYTDIFVYFNRDPSAGAAGETIALGGRESFLGVVFATPEETNHSTDTALNFLCSQARDRFKFRRTLEVFADMIPDVKTAENLLSLICRRAVHRRFVARWTTYLNLVDIEVADVVRIQHPLLPPSANGVTYEITGKEISPNGCTTSWEAEEIRQRAFGSFTEHWEPPIVFVPQLIHAETWDIPEEILNPPLAPPTPQLPCNPWIESWEPSTLIFSDPFEQWLAGTALTRNLNWGFNMTSAGPFFDSGFNFDEQALYSNVKFESPFSDSERQQDTPGRYLLDVSNSGRLVADEGVTALLTPNEVGTFPAMLFVDGENFFINEDRFNLFDTNNNFTYSIFVKLTEKPTRSMGITNGQILSGGSITDRVFDIWWDQPLDRFVVQLHSTIADATLGQTSFDNMSQRVVMNALGSPSIGTWYNILIKWEPGTNTLTARVNDASENSAVIAPEFSLQEAQIRQVGRASVFQTGLLGPDAGHTLRGGVTLMYMWSRTLSGAEITQVYGSGNGAGWPSF